MFNILRIGGFLSAVLALLPLLGLALIFSTSPSVSPLDILDSSSRNWLDIIQEKNTATLLWASFKLGLCVSVLSTLVGSFIAWISFRKTFFGSNALSTLCLLPLAMPSYVLALSLQGSLGEMSFLWPELREGFWPVCLCLTIVCSPYAQLTVGAALRRLPAAEEEAAHLLGATKWRTFKTCLWPVLRPSVAFSMLISFLYAISDFGALVFLDYPALTWRLYDAANGQDMAGAAVLGFALLVCVIPVLVFAQILRGQSQAKSGVANPRQLNAEPASIGQISGFLLLVMLIVGVGVLLPGMVLSDWAIEGLAADKVFENPIPALLDSIQLALIGAVFTLLIAFPAAWSACRNREGPMLEQAVYLSSALPGVLLAFGLMAVALELTQTPANYRLLMSSGALLFLGYAMRFSAEAFGPLRTGIAHLDKRQEESARVLGSGSWGWLFKIALPLLRPNMMAAFFIAFLAILKELPVTMLLGQTMGSSSLAWRIYDRQTEGDLHDAALHALLLLALALSLAVMSHKWRRHV